MPVRYTSPSLGAQGNPGLNKGQWQLGVVYRWLHADKVYVGHDVVPTAGPHGLPIRVGIHTLELNLGYAVSERLSLNLGVPFQTGYATRGEDDLALHTNSATGLGDVSLTGTMWLLDPLDHAHGNISLGLGVK